MDPMRVTVFGASGKIGRLVVEALLADGHDVVAYVRSPGKLGLVHDRMTVVPGPLSDGAGIIEAVRGSAAVISALGPSLDRRAKGTPVTDGTRNIVTAMKAVRVRRYVGLATPSVSDPRDRPTVKAKVYPVAAKVLFPNALVEIVGMTRAVTDSDLDWTIARIVDPNDKQSKNRLRVGFLGRDRIGSAIARADIAAFLVAQLTDDTYSGAMPAISN
jgi:putative NADH-flavin reductase